MKRQLLLYFIATHLGPIPKAGYAIDSKIGVRLCVRKSGNCWQIEHYDTGFYIRGGYKTLREAAEDGTAYVVKMIRLGRWDRAIKEVTA